MDPPKVLLERTFLQAVTDPADGHHEQAVVQYRALVDQYETESILLVAVHTDLRDFAGLDRHHVFAPVDRLWVGFQHRRAVRRSAVADDPQFALTLVMAERHHVRTIATFDPRFLEFELTVVPVAAVG